MPRRHPGRKRLGAHLSRVTDEIKTQVIRNPNQLSESLRKIVDEFAKAEDVPLPKSKRRFNLADLKAHRRRQDTLSRQALFEGDSLKYARAIVANTDLLLSMVAGVVQGHGTGTTRNESIHAMFRRRLGRRTCIPARRHRKT